MSLWPARIPCLRRRILVNLEDGETAIEGVLFEHRAPWLTLKSARLLTKDRAPVPMDGDIVIECAKVAFIQVVGS
jgi:hypothetical protein